MSSSLKRSGLASLSTTDVCTAGFSDAKNHDLRGFDEGDGTVARFSAQLLGGIGGDDGGDVLFADGEGDLGKQPAELYGDDASDELVAAADSAEITAARDNVASVQFFREHAVDFAFRNAVMATRSFRGLDLTAIDPLLERGIADAEDAGGFSRGKEFLHGGLPELSRMEHIEPLCQYVFIRIIRQQGSDANRRPGRARSVTEGLAGFKGVGDALLGLLFATERDEGFAFEIKDVLLADELRRGERASRQDVGQLAGDVTVVFRSVAAADEHVNRELRAGEELLAEDLHLGGLSAFLPGSRRGLPAASMEGESRLLGIGDEAVAVHGNKIFAAEVAEVAALFGAGANLGHGDVLEDRFEGVEEIEIFHAGGMLVGANKHFLGAAATWDETDACFDEADVGLGSGVDSCGVQADFTTTAEGHALRGGNNRLFRVLDGEIGVLKLLHGHVEFIPFLFLGGNEDQQEVGANREVDGLIGDDHGIEIGFKAFKAFMKHGDEVGADGVHLGVEFAADNAVAEINETSARIALDFAASLLERFENDNAGRFFDSSASARSEVEDRSDALFGFIETLAATGKNFFNDRRKSSALLLNLRREGRDADGVDEFEGAKFPGKPPAHGTIDVNNVIGNLRDAASGIEAHFGKCAPEKLLSFVAFLAFEQRADESAKALASVLNRLAHLEGGKPRLLSGAIVHRVEVESENFLFALALDALIEALTGLLAEPAAASHILDERGNLVNLARLIVWHAFVNVPDDVNQDVQADDVRGAKGGGLGPAHGRTGAGVHFLDGHAEGGHQAEGIKHGESADAVGNEVRRVFGDDHAFAEAAVAEVAESFEHVRGGARTRDDFHQL